MKQGTKSLLFGTHQFIYHPITVLIAWIKLYGRPSFKEFLCIIIHDWGYWGKPNMDGEEGEKHPEWSANKVRKWFGEDYYYFCLYHSRHYARKDNAEPSKLCWADKLSIKYDPWWFYIFRAKITGELKEYRLKSDEAGFTNTSYTNREWFNWIKGWLVKQGIEQKSSVKLVSDNQNLNK